MLPKHLEDFIITFSSRGIKSDALKDETNCSVGRDENSELNAKVCYQVPSGALKTRSLCGWSQCLCLFQIELPLVTLLDPGLTLPAFGYFTLIRAMLEILGRNGPETSVVTLYRLLSQGTTAGFAPLQITDRSSQ